uniref:UBL3-like ubiquitin domain-containing protein n=1 Tax=Parascaris equorum TaxID=6256 RepID=A0A914SIT3_PAREQ
MGALSAVRIQRHPYRIFCRVSYCTNELLNLHTLSGKTKEFLFASNVSAQEITQFVFDNWPQEWEEERVGSSSLLKLIYHGRFLHGSVTLSALSLPAGKTTVMHLVTRENLPEPNSGGSFFRFHSLLLV